MTHRAYVVSSLGPPHAHRVQDVPTPSPTGSEVLISVEAAGVNYPDTLLLRGRYQFTPSLPFTPGSEACGTIAAVGPDVTSHAVGDRVIARTPTGAFSEKLLVPEDSVLPLPAGMSPAEGAALCLAHGTALYALRRVAQLRRGETLLVLGAAGGVGLAACELGRLLGARVVGCASTGEKLAACAAKGAEVLLQYGPEAGEREKRRLRDELRELGGVDVCVDPVGGEWSELAIRAMAWGGRYLVVGFAAGSIPRVPLNLPLLKGCSLMGVFWGSWCAREPAAAAEDFALLAKWHAEGSLRPLCSQTFELARAADALALIEQRGACGKVCLLMQNRSKL
ncbi:hypothetical protein AB1Y20_013430 [Prymnesium parvum]|uniref:Enoyl reductase (ER) domain-containing protein n=1 Tax=Prymnesium parvum TaxID=97485 RepID=A0AB34IGM9_PRYPA